MVGFNSLDSTYKNIINDIPQTPHNHPVVASLYSNSSTPSPRSGAASGFSSISLSPGDCSHGVAAGKDVLHILRLNNNVKDGSSNRSSRLEEIKSVRISQVRNIEYSDIVLVVSRVLFAHILFAHILCSHLMLTTFTYQH